MKSDCGSLDIRVKAVDVCWSGFRSFNVPSSRADLMLPSKDSQSSFKARGRWEYLKQWFSNFSGLRPSFENGNSSRLAMQILNGKTGVCEKWACFLFPLMTSLTSTLTCISFRRKMLDNCCLLRNLLLIPIIAENPILNIPDTRDSGLLPEYAGTGLLLPLLPGGT
ncbi:hypothetical protein T02_798 [Trichinella nativa]|uniref:Uncharacterized protein n=1 Tax=Trichinella nativa TaxID=6335 RepID=A0A0V1KTY1_9BILA|nr:hypothetical protein T02_798 [Trichinella nativa]